MKARSKYICRTAVAVIHLYAVKTFQFYELVRRLRQDDGKHQSKRGLTATTTDSPSVNPLDIYFVPLGIMRDLARGSSMGILFRFDFVWVVRLMAA